jgi:hypothetical protein
VSACSPVPAACASTCIASNSAGVCLGVCHSVLVLPRQPSHPHSHPSPVCDIILPRFVLGVPVCVVLPVVPDCLFCAMLCCVVWCSSRRGNGGSAPPPPAPHYYPPLPPGYDPPPAPVPSLHESRDARNGVPSQPAPLSVSPFAPSLPLVDQPSPRQPLTYVGVFQCLHWQV